MAQPDEHHEHAHHGTHGHKHQADSSWIEDLLGFLNHLGHKDQGEKHLEEILFKDDTRLADLKFPLVEFANFTHVLSTMPEVGSSNVKGQLYVRPPILYEQHQLSSYALRGPPTI